MATLGGIASIVVGDRSLVGSEVARLRGDLLIDNSGKIQISTSNDPPSTSILLGGDDAIGAYGAVSTTYIRGGDHTAAGSKGVSLLLRPGRGNAVADDGSLTLQDGRAVNHLVIGPTALTMNLGPTTSDYTVICGVDTANITTIKTTTIRCADNATGGTGKGHNITIRPGRGDAVGTDDGQLSIQNARGQSVLTTSATTSTNIYANNTQTFSLDGTKIGARLYISFATGANPYEALSGDSIVFGYDRSGGAAVPVSTGLIRGGDHTGTVNHKGVNITMRPGKGNTTAEDGVTTFQDAQTNTVATIDYLGWSLARMGRMTPTSTSANPYAVLDTDLVILIKASGDVDLPAAPTTNRVLYIFSAGTYTPSIDGNGKNINGSASKLALGNNEGVMMIYDGTEWWAWRSV